MQLISKSLKLLVRPKLAWHEVADTPSGTLETLLGHSMLLALIPAVCWYLGVTNAGWSIAGASMKLTAMSAMPMCVLFYLVMVGGVFFLGAMVSWMTSTYVDDEQIESWSTNLPAGVKLVSLTATPFFIAGLLGLQPVLWLDLLVGTLVATWCIYLLYTGLPSVMKVTPEKGFLFASAVLAVALVAFVGVLTLTVLLWEFGPSPEYTY